MRARASVRLRRTRLASLTTQLAVTLAAIVCGSMGDAVASTASYHPQYEITALLSSSERRIAGTVTVQLVNTTNATLGDAVFVLFANRFARPDDLVDDFNRPFIYPEERFDAGWSTIIAAYDAGAPIAAEPLSRPHVPQGCLVRMPIRPLPPGDVRTLTIEFETRVPRRFGTFGIFDDQVTLLGGWHPYLAALDANGTWRDDIEPPLADFDVELARPAGEELIVNGRSFPAGNATARAELRDVHFVALLAAPRFERVETFAADTRIIFFRRPERRTSRIAPGPTPTETLLETLRAIVADRPSVPGSDSDSDTLVVVEAPLRLNLTASGEGAVVVSDRTLKVHPLIRPFHELQLAQAVYEESMRFEVARREPAGDFWWVAEGLSSVLARRFVGTKRAYARSVYDWIELFNVFAIVDRFENSPNIPFVESFFERTRVADPMHSEILTFNNDLPPGHVVLGKLESRLGSERFGRVVDRCVAAAVPFRRCARETSDAELDEFFGEWLLPYPALNYRVAGVTRNEPVGSLRRTTVEVERDSSRPVSEPVTVRLHSLGRSPRDIVWDSEEAKGTIQAETEHRVSRVVLDPDHALIEDRREDNSSPQSLQVVLDTANVEVSSTEFGVGALMVGRARYDYRKDIGLSGVYTDRGLGFAVGPRLHWGTPIDPTLYRQNLYLYYGFQELDGDFKDKSRPTFRTDGQQASLGLRYDYSNVYAFDNPTHARNLRLFADWYDASIGSDFDYVTWGIDVSLTQPLGSYRTIGALEILNGFSEPLGGDVVPNQGLYSLGGSRSIRGIGAEDELGRNILLLRTEIRRSIWPEVDFNLLDVLVLRRAQLRFFVDCGKVDDSAGHVYDVGSFAAGVGIGFGAVYDFMGFFPSLFFIEIATRVDEPSEASDVQVLFGTRQTF